MPPLPKGTLSREERAQLSAHYVKELRINRPHMRTDGYPQVLWNCINRYVRKVPSGTGLTLFFAHANGFPKEIWEPTLARLLDSPAGNLIDEVWAWESIQHGDAAIINRGSLSKFFDWSDNTRDIVNFFTNFLPSQPSPARLPLHLTRIPEIESLDRRSHGFLHRRVMVVGHSYGGCTSTLAVQNFPALFDSLVLIDPVIPKPFTSEEVGKVYHDKTDVLLTGSLLRRDTWSSREEALATFLKNPFFRAWHPDVLSVYVDAGLYETTDDQGNAVVKLKMPGIYESICFSERVVGHEVYHNLAAIEERIPIRWIVPGTDEADQFGAPGATGQRVWARPRNSSNIRIAGAGHLIAQERPIELAEDLESFILRHYLHRRVPSQTSLRSSL